MSRNRFNKGESHKIELSADEWILVKRDLDNGDSKRLDEAGLHPPMWVEGKIIRPIDWSRYEIERAAIFLLDWNLRDSNDKEMALKLPDGSIDLKMLRALNPEDFDEINQAILAYTIRRSVEKNALRGKTPASPSGDPAASDPTSTPSSGSASEAGTPT